MDLCLQANPLFVASSGMFVNLSAVMLKLCEPFLDASCSKKDKLDARYVLQGGRLDFRYGGRVQFSFFCAIQIRTPKKF